MCCAPAKRYLRVEGCSGRSCRPVVSMCASAASPRQYSAALSVEMIFGRSPAAASLVEEPAGAPGQRIGRHHVGKRKDMAPQRCRLVGGLREAMIESTPSRPRDVHVEAIVGTAAVLATVEAEAQEMPLHAARLRDAIEDEGAQPVAARIGGRGHAQERRHVARGEEAEPSHRGPVSFVDELVDPPWLEAALEPDVLGRGLHSARGGLACEAPARARYQSVVTVLPVAHEETCAGLLPGRGRQRSVDAVGEEARRSALVRSDLDHRLPANGLATLHGQRCDETQKLRARVDVPLPTDGGYRVAASE